MVIIALIVMKRREREVTDKRNKWHATQLLITLWPMPSLSLNSDFWPTYWETPCILCSKHDFPCYGISPWPVWLSSPGCALSWFVVYSLSCRAWETRRLLTVLRTTWQQLKYQCVMNIFLIPNPKKQHFTSYLEENALYPSQTQDSLFAKRIVVGRETILP